MYNRETRRHHLMVILDQKNRTLLSFSLDFDACTGTVFSTLCNGAQLLVAAISEFESCMARATIVAIKSSVLSTIHDVQVCSQVRTVMIGDEALNLRLVQKWSASGRRIYNGYGPTEMTIGLMVQVNPSKPIPLGHPVSNSRVVLLDGDVESDYGGICIAGPDQAVGYYRDEALTAEKFIYRQGDRMYKTGDFANRVRPRVCWSS
jgi:non-ribosomal peptide synthetase component F